MAGVTGQRTVADWVVYVAMHGCTRIVIYADRRMVSVSMAITGDREFVQCDVDRRLVHSG